MNCVLNDDQSPEFESLQIHTIRCDCIHQLIDVNVDTQFLIRAHDDNPVEYEIRCVSLIGVK